MMSITDDLVTSLILFHFVIIILLLQDCEHPGPATGHCAVLALRDHSRYTVSLPHIGGGVTVNTFCTLSPWNSVQNLADISRIYIFYFIATIFRSSFNLYCMISFQKICNIFLLLFNVYQRWWVNWNLKNLNRYQVVSICYNARHFPFYTYC